MAKTVGQSRKKDKPAPKTKRPSFRVGGPNDPKQKLIKEYNRLIKSGVSGDDAMDRAINNTDDFFGSVNKKKKKKK